MAPYQNVTELGNRVHSVRMSCLPDDLTICGWAAQAVIMSVRPFVRSSVRPFVTFANIFVTVHAIDTKLGTHVRTSEMLTEFESGRRPITPTAAIFNCLTNWFYRIFTRFGTWRSFWDPLLFSHHTNPPGRHFDFFDELILSHIYAFRNVAIVLRPTFIFAPYEPTRPPFWIFWRTDFIAYLRVSERGDRSETNFYFRTILTHPAAILIFLTNWFNRIFTRFGTWRSFWDQLSFSHHLNPPGRHFPFWFFWRTDLIAYLCVSEHGDRFETNFHFRTIWTHPAAILIFWRTDFIAYLRVSERGDRSETHFYFRTILTHPAAILIFLTNWFYRIFTRFGTWRSFWDQLSFSHHLNPPGRHFDFFDELILSHIYAFRNVAIVLRPTFIFAPY